MLVCWSSFVNSNDGLYIYIYLQRMALKVFDSFWAVLLTWHFNHGNLSGYMMYNDELQESSHNRPLCGEFCIKIEPGFTILTITESKCPVNITATPLGKLCPLNFNCLYWIINLVSISSCSWLLFEKLSSGSRLTSSNGKTVQTVRNCWMAHFFNSSFMQHQDSFNFIHDFNTKMSWLLHILWLIPLL